MFKVDRIKGKVITIERIILDNADSLALNVGDVVIRNSTDKPPKKNDSPKIKP